MSRLSELVATLSRRDLEQNLKRFLWLHQERLRRIQDDLRPPQRDFLTSLPLLLHINHPMLPGYVSSDAPAGVSDFQPSAELMRIARGLFRGFDQQRRAPIRYCIQGIYLMGSVGSMAYSRRSDLDIWVCHRPDLQPQELHQLKTKLQKLEQEAARRQLEIHFFPMNLDEFRRGETGVLSKESSGSTQHILLLEEFYRTGVYMAGRYPIWWLVPPDLETSHEAFWRSIQERRLVDDEYLDFGSIDQIPAAEFLSSARWQLFKGVDSPYKSVLKILLIEAYADQYPNIAWLCQDIKRAIHANQLDPDKLDSYLLMYQRVEAYLQGRNEPERLNLARRCFYFKVDRPLSKISSPGTASWQQRLIKSLANNWQWDGEILDRLDSRRDWKVRQVVEERNNLVRELSRSYRVLLNFARQYGGADQGSSRDLKLLGRKLYASLEHRPGKIDSINPGISSNLSEPLLSLHQQQDRYAIHLGEPRPEQLLMQEPIRQSRTLIEVLAWAMLNGILASDSRLKSCLPLVPPSQQDLQGVRMALGRFFEQTQGFKVPIRALGKDPRLKGSAVFINLDDQPPAIKALAGGQLISDRPDPLSFSSKRICLIMRIEQLLITTWGEVLCFRHQGEAGLMDALVKYLRLSLGQDNSQPAPKVESYCFAESLGSHIARRVEDVFAFVAHIYGPNGPGANSRYLLPLGLKHYMIYQGTDGYAWRTFASQEELLQSLADPVEVYSPVIPDPQALTDTLIPTLCARREQGLMQLFFILRDWGMDSFVLDENGGVFHQALREGEPKQLLMRQYRFLQSLQQRRALGSNDNMSQLLMDQIPCHQITRLEHGGWQVRAIIPPGGVPDEPYQLRLMGSSLEAGDEDIILACDDQEFSRADYGDGLFAAVVAHILNMRKGHKDYPIYLTGVEPQSILSDQGWNSMRVLGVKKNIEERLNMELKSALT